MSTSLENHFLKYSLHLELDENSDVNKRLPKATHHINNKQIKKTKVIFCPMLCTLLIW